MTITLTPMYEAAFEGDSQVVPAESWVELVRQQLGKPDGWHTGWEGGDIIALEDRDSLNVDWPEGAR